MGFTKTILGDPEGTYPCGVLRVAFACADAGPVVDLIYRSLKTRRVYECLKVMMRLHEIVILPLFGCAYQSDHNLPQIHHMPPDGLETKYT